MKLETKEAVHAHNCQLWYIVFCLFAIISCSLFVIENIESQLGPFKVSYTNHVHVFNCTGTGLQVTVKKLGCLQM